MSPSAHRRADALRTDLAAALAYHDLPPDAALLVVAQLLGYVASLQDPRAHSQEWVNAMVSEYFALGSTGISPYGLIQ
jgi:hypothetical protein